MAKARLEKLESIRGLAAVYVVLHHLSRTFLPHRWYRLPFVFGPLRTTGAGTRTVVGILLGVVFFLITRTIENGGQLFGLNPAVVGWAPTTIIAVCTAVAISRTR